MYAGEKYKELLLEDHGRIFLIKFNQPKRKNCLNTEAYREIGQLLRAISEDKRVAVVAFTGVGNVFTAGNDLSQAKHVDNIEEYLKVSNRYFKEMLLAIIHCPKVIVCLVNGPCIGIGATLSALADLVWCSENAYFYTPFVQLGIVPEAGSSYLFPILLGRSLASELLLFGQRLTAKEALRCKFVSRIYKLREFHEMAWKSLMQYANQQPIEALLMSKKLMRQVDKDVLLRAIDNECIALEQRLQSAEFIQAILKFSQKKSKL